MKMREAYGPFSGLSEDRARLDKVAGTNRPGIIGQPFEVIAPAIVEAHNARSSLSFDTLARFDPS